MTEKSRKKVPASMLWRPLSSFDIGMDAVIAMRKVGLRTVRDISIYTVKRLVIGE